MKIVVQRVKEAKVEVDGNVVGKIDKGFLVLLGVTHKDTKEQADYLVKKLCKLRVFRDENDKMNLSLLDIGGGALVVSQFTRVEWEPVEELGETERGTGGFGSTGVK